MRYVENGVPEDAGKLCFHGMTIPLCELTEEEYMKVVFGIENYKGKRKRGLGVCEPVPQENKHLKEPIENMLLSMRAQHCLQRAGIKTIGDLCAMTEFDLAKLRNMGEKTMKEIKAQLAELELSLKEVSEE